MNVRVFLHDMLLESARKLVASENPPIRLHERQLRQLERDSDGRLLVFMGDASAVDEEVKTHAVYRAKNGHVFIVINDEIIVTTNGGYGLTVRRAKKNEGSTL